MAVRRSVEMIQVCGYIFLGIDEKRHKCTLEDNHYGGCYCEECQVGEKDRGFSNHYRPVFQRAVLEEEEVIQNWIEQHERKKFPFRIHDHQ